MNQKCHRRRIFIDRPIQVALLFRATLYWAICLMAQLLLVFFFGIVTLSSDDYAANSPKLYWHLQLSIVSWAVLLPVILFDLLKLSHRWVGPIFRLRKCLHALSRRESIPPLRFRDGDFWQELAGDMNAVAAELNRQRIVALIDGEPELVESEHAPSTHEDVRRRESEPASAAAF